MDRRPASAHVISVNDIIVDQARNVAELRADGSRKHRRWVASNSPARVEEQLWPQQLAGPAHRVFSRGYEAARHLTESDAEPTPHCRGELRVLGVVRVTRARRLVCRGHWLLPMCPPGPGLSLMHITKIDRVRVIRVKSCLCGQS
jgi:hypothetical protein